MAKYKLENGLPQKITYESGVSNPSDKMLDDLNVGMYLDNTAVIPTYDVLTHYVQTKYTIEDGKIISGYDILVIVPSEGEVISNKIDILKQRANATETTILDLLMDGGV